MDGRWEGVGFKIRKTPSSVSSVSSVFSSSAVFFPLHAEEIATKMLPVGVRL
jgi:hypothetical protein